MERQSIRHKEIFMRICVVRFPFAPPFAGRRWREATDEGQRGSLAIVAIVFVAHFPTAELPLIRPLGTFSP